MSYMGLLGCGNSCAPPDHMKVDESVNVIVKNGNWISKLNVLHCCVCTKYVPSVVYAKC